MLKQTILLLFLFTGVNTFAQATKPNTLSNKNTLSVDVGLFYTSMLSKDFIGGTVDVKYYWSKRFCTGLSMYGSSKRTTDAFIFNVKEPRLDYAGFSLINEFNFVNTKVLKMNLTLNNGVAQIELLDRSEHVQTHSDNIFLSTHAKSISYNTYYLLEPGLDISVL